MKVLINRGGHSLILRPETEFEVDFVSKFYQCKHHVARTNSCGEIEVLMEHHLSEDEYKASMKDPSEPL